MVHTEKRISYVGALRLANMKEDLAGLNMKDTKVRYSGSGGFLIKAAGNGKARLKTESRTKLLSRVRRRRLTH